MKRSSLYARLRGRFPLWRSFSARLTFYVVLIVAVIFLLASVIFFLYARRIVQQEAVRHAESELTGTLLRIENVLQTVETAADNMVWAIEENLDSPDSLYRITQRFLQNNPVITGSSIAFEPDYFPEKGTRFAPYTYRTKGGRLQNKQLGSEDYEYHYMDWYQIPKLLGRNYWSEPYYDSGGGECIMTTYSRVLRNGRGEIYGIFTADVDLAQLTELVGRIHPYPNSYNVMIGRGGTYLVHPYPERILAETVFTATAEMNDSTTMHIGRAMIAGKRGYEVLQNDADLSYLFYAPVEKTGWSVAVVCTHEEVFASLDRMTWLIVSVLTTGLVLLLCFCVGAVRKLTRPLKRFAESAESIAEGNLHTPLPEITTRDEMGQLRASLEYMQRSLAEYIEELTRTTSAKERIESELRIASSIQMGMIPKIFPPFPDRNDLDLFAMLIPAKEVGGDLYDFFIREERLYFTIGDVSGKGVPASLFMAVTRSLFRTMAGQYADPAEIVAALNHAVAETNESNMFVTLFVGVLELKTGILSYCNAGHNPPVWLSAQGECRFVETDANIPVGVLDGYPYTKQTEALHPGEALLLYTDGLTEAENPEKRLFGEDNLLQKADACKGEPARKVVEYLRHEVETHAAGADQSDDLTILCVRYFGAKSVSSPGDKT